MGNKLATFIASEDYKLDFVIIALPISADENRSMSLLAVKLEQLSCLIVLERFSPGNQEGVFQQPIRDGCRQIESTMPASGGHCTVRTVAPSLSL